MDKLLTVSETAEILRTNRNHVYKLIHANELKAVKIGSLKVPQSELVAFISSRTLAPASSGKGAR